MRKKFFQQFMIILVAVAILAAGTVYMKSILVYAIHRDNMNVTAEKGASQGWTDDMYNDYNQERSKIVNNGDPIVRWAYNCNAQMHKVSCVVAVVMLVAGCCLWKAKRTLKRIKIIAKKRKKRQQQPPQQQQQPKKLMLYTIN